LTSNIEICYNDGVKKYRVNFTDFAINPSERCNLKCKVCQVGEPSNAEIDEPTANAAFRDIEHINNLGIVSGEVMMAPRALTAINGALERNGTKYDRSSGYLNGTLYNGAAMAQLVDMVKRAQNGPESRSGWAVSFDEWHVEDALKQYGLDKYAETFYKLFTHPIINGRIIPSSFIFSEGRAENLTEAYGLPIFPPNPEMDIPHAHIDRENGIINASFMLMNCHGDAVTGGNYANHKKTKYGNVISDDGVANILLHSDRVKRHNSYNEMATAFNDIYGAEMLRRQKFASTKEFADARAKLLNDAANDLLNIGAINERKKTD